MWFRVGRLLGYAWSRVSAGGADVSVECVPVTTIPFPAAGGTGESKALAGRKVFDERRHESCAEGIPRPGSFAKQ